MKKPSKPKYPKAIASLRDWLNKYHKKGDLFMCRASPTVFVITKEPVFSYRYVEPKKIKPKKKKEVKSEGEWRLVHTLSDMPKWEVICPHGVGHHKGIHGCDGCCDKAPKALWKKVTKDK